MAGVDLGGALQDQGWGWPKRLLSGKSMRCL